MSALAALIDRDVSDPHPGAPLSALPDDDAGSEGASFIVDIVHFTGPLDLLLTLLREEQIDIYDIPIARIAEQFLERIRTLRLDEAADYLEMAARLLRIKAQTLLPRHAGEEPWDDPRAELVRRLLEYQQVREVVDVLEARAESRRLRFSRPLLAVPERSLGAPRFEAALADLLAAVDRVMRAVRAPVVHSIVPRALDVPAAIEAARALLATRSRCRWSDLLARDAEVWQVLSVLLALLELARLGECSLQQLSTFAGIEITASDRVVPAPTSGTDVALEAAPAPSLPQPATPAHDAAGSAP